MITLNKPAETRSPVEAGPSDFIRDIVATHVAEKKYRHIHTRFPPEPNGYLHIGHAKSICLNFGIAREFSGICNLRMDDTNPVKEETEYVESIRGDVNWLICGWADHVLGLKSVGQKREARTGDTSHLPGAAAAGEAHGEPFYASDYFDQLFAFALDLIAKGNAYVDDLSPEDTDRYRIAGQDSP